MHRGNESRKSLRSILLLCLFVSSSKAFHDCIQASNEARRRRVEALLSLLGRDVVLSNEDGDCAGGICVGMTNGPHQGGNSSYPVSWNGVAGTMVKSYMRVPQLPKKLDNITYYIWTDVFFGDASLGRMNQLVPQLLLGDVLDGSSGSPHYKPAFHKHSTWAFGAHYFFEIWNPETKEKEAHAAYGDLYPTWSGEHLYTAFQLSPGDGPNGMENPKWTLTMGVVGDGSRVSTLVVDQPYMGMGADWEETTLSWTELSYQNMCINACWELYGARNAAHLPSSGAEYFLEITQPKPGVFPFTSWERDEGNGKCPSCQVREGHGDQVQAIQVDISVIPYAAS